MAFWISEGYLGSAAVHLAARWLMTKFF